MLLDSSNEQVRIPNVIALVGLPARGKTYISHKLCRYLNWIGIKTKAFNVGEYRRKACNLEEEGEYEFFSPYNAKGQKIRDECARLAIEDLGRYLDNKEGEVAILDATNTTRQRRRLLVDYCRQKHHDPAFRVFFIESICDDPEIINSNISEVKINSPDYKGIMTEEQAKEDFLKRIENYKLQYEPLDEESDEDHSFIKVINAGKSFFVHNVNGHVQSRVVYFLMNIHLLPRSIYLTRHGESEYNRIGRLGGDSPLSENGLQYAQKLRGYFEEEELHDLRIWSSQKIRAAQTASTMRDLAAHVEYWKVLDEIDAGICEGLTYEDFEARYPKQFAERDKDKYHYRYPSGESYEDLVARLEPVIMELERQSNVLVVSHQAVLRCILAYFTNKNRDDLPYLKVPLHTVIKLTPKAYSCEVEMFKFDIEAVNTYREKPGTVPKENDNVANGTTQSVDVKLPLLLTQVLGRTMSEWVPTVPAVLRESKETVFEWRIPGEQVEFQDNRICYITNSLRVPGTVFLTNYRLRFEDDEDEYEGRRGFIFNIPLGCIAKVEKVGHSKTGNSEMYGLLIGCKDMRDVRFGCNPDIHSRRPLYEALLRLSFPSSKTEILNQFCGVYKKHFDRNSYEIDGWKLYDPRTEFKRMGIPNDQWVISNINSNYDLSETYPLAVAVPVAAEKKGIEFLIRVADFRSRQRIPVLCWHHPQSQAAITRSSQPLSGMTNRKSADDEDYLEMIMSANAECYSLSIYDARPLVNARLNRAKGGGYEEGYDQCGLKFLNIHNIHVVRDSLRKLRDVLFPKVDERNYFKLLDDSKWFHHLQSILEGSMEIVRDVELNKQSVLIHCSDGWDRTAQLSCLSMIQLDPYYRTIEGFAVLIEKEWCSFGHKFAQRYGHWEDKAGDAERSPIFVQFIDCVYQLLVQFEPFFEFTHELLIFILEELYSCRFGTFLYNSEKQRILENRCPKTTVSIWTYVLMNRKLFSNPGYHGLPLNERKVLYVNPSISMMKLFRDWHARYNPFIVSPQSAAMKLRNYDRSCGQYTLKEELMKEIE
ncbi:unnamed protein product [Auanema sp. JU1783]|nr:unnamed protein product [Auanema sp. JU1783]